MNSGPCVGGPLKGLGTFSRESETLIVRVVSFEGGEHGEQPPFTETRYYWRNPSVRFATVADAPNEGGSNSDLQIPHFTHGHWIWEHHQERDDLPADRN